MQANIFLVRSSLEKLKKIIYAICSPSLSDTWHTTLRAEPIEFITDFFQDLPKTFIQNSQLGNFTATLHRLTDKQLANVNCH